MHTQCPKCDTQYIVSAAELRQALGQVKCGECNTIFNALDFLAETPNSEIPGTGTPGTTTPTVAAPNINTADINTPAASDHEVTPNIAPATTAAEPAASADKQPNADEPISVGFDPDASPTPQSSIPTDTTTDDVTDDSPPNINAAPQSQRYYPLEPVSEKPRRTWAWAMAAAVLITVLIGQLLSWKWHIAEPYARQAETALGISVLPEPNQTTYASGETDNLMTEVHNVDNVSIFPQQIRRKRNGQDIIELSGTLMSVSDTPVAFPKLYVQMLNSDGQAIAARVFDPSEYNNSNFPINKPLPSGLTVALKLEIANAVDADGQPISLDVQLVPGG